MNAAGMLSPESTEEREIAEPLRERAPLAETAEETAEESESAEPLRESAPPPVVSTAETLAPARSCVAEKDAAPPLGAASAGPTVSEPAPMAV